MWRPRRVSRAMPFTIHAPLLHLTKADIAREAQRLGLDAALSHSCYDPAAGRPRLRPLRRVPAEGQGLCRGRARGPDGLRMTYAVKECFLTLQGEGVQAGSRAVFLRFAGCNLWSGREQDRATAQCTFCDTDFVGTDGEGGGKFASAAELADACRGVCGARRERRLVVITGGEPMLQLDEALSMRFTAAGSESRSRPTERLPATPGIDWLCVSPKAGTDVVQRRGDELKLVWPQDGSIRPSSRAGHSTISWSSRWTASKREAAVEAAIRAGDGAAEMAPVAAGAQAARVALSLLGRVGRCVGRGLRRRGPFEGRPARSF